MLSKLTKKIIITVCLLSILLLAFTQFADQYSEAYTSKTLESVAITYGVARAMNASVSVLQGTEVNASPAGMGVTFSIGEVLDPVNDLIERFSFIVMLSMASLALQKILILIGSSIGFNALLLISTLWYLTHVWFYTNQIGKQLALRCLYFIVYIRFVLVLVVGANFGVDYFFMSDLQEESKQALLNNQLKMESLTNHLNTQSITPQTEEQSMLESINAAWESIQTGFSKATSKVDGLKALVEDSIHSMVDLIAMFVLQTIILPLLFIWLFYRGIRALSLY
jgi:hypothetical protein|tara:strand:- start:535 stop:1377 length:843 start_codon:yes stop_codon:yes gene_type:complete